MEGVMEGNGAGEAEAEAVAPIVREGRDGREGVIEAAWEGACEGVAEAAGAKGAPASVESGSNPSNLAPKRQTSLFVK